MLHRKASRIALSVNVLITEELPKKLLVKVLFLTF